MLEDQLLTHPTHRLAAFYILHDLYKSEPIINNPFLPVFLDSLQRNSNSNNNNVENIVEKQFLIIIINSSYPKDVCTPILIIMIIEWITREQRSPAQSPNIVYILSLCFISFLICNTSLNFISYTY